LVVVAAVVVVVVEGVVVGDFVVVEIVVVVIGLVVMLWLMWNLICYWLMLNDFVVPSNVVVYWVWWVLGRIVWMHSNCEI
jgi:hypothetical protein